MKVRLQRFLADCGVASRRECEGLIEAGRVRVNGEVKTRMPVMIDPAKDRVTVDEAEVGADEAAGAVGGATGELREERKVYFLLNKPKGILVTTSDPDDRKVVGELMTGVKERVFPVGRLDMDSRGALIMTNDGELANRLTHPRFGVEKTYVVEVDGRVGHAEIEKVKGGMWLGPERRGARREERGAGREGDGIRTERFKVKLIGRERGRTILEVKISEGKNREIRRVMARVGHTVRDLNRVAIAGKITLKGLAIGAFRELTEAEVKFLFKTSAADAHEQKRAATQAWFEKKEMEKERKRIVAEEAAGKRRPVVPVEPSKKPFRKKPVPKGKKPFVPPTGRNAGKALGGNFIGRQRFEKAAGQMEGIDESAVHEGRGREAPEHEDAETIKREVRAQHPLGGMAREEE